MFSIQTNVSSFSIHFNCTKLNFLLWNFLDKLHVIKNNKKIDNFQTRIKSKLFTYECLYNIFNSIQRPVQIFSSSVCTLSRKLRVTCPLSFRGSNVACIDRYLDTYLNTISPFYPLNGFLNLKRTMQEADAIFTIFLAHLISTLRTGERMERDDDNKTMNRRCRAMICI